MSIQCIRFHKIQHETAVYPVAADTVLAACVAVFVCERRRGCDPSLAPCWRGVCRRVRACVTRVRDASLAPCWRGVCRRVRVCATRVRDASLAPCWRGVCRRVRVCVCSRVRDASLAACCRQEVEAVRIVDTANSALNTSTEALSVAQETLRMPSRVSDDLEGLRTGWGLDKHTLATLSMLPTWTGWGLAPHAHTGYT